MFYYRVKGFKIFKIPIESCYPPDDKGKIMVHEGPCGYSFYKLNKVIFKCEKKAKKAVARKRHKLKGRK